MNRDGFPVPEIAFRLRVAGERIDGHPTRPVLDPYDGSPVGNCPVADAGDLRRALAAGAAFRATPARGERATILRRVSERLLDERAAVARLITGESGLCLKDTLHEVERAANVFSVAADATSFDDSLAFPGDIGTSRAARRSITFREPLRLACAITPFNHPLNQVAHKVAPAVAAGTPLVLKPSEKTPLSALLLGELLADCGLPGPMLSILPCDPDAFLDAVVADPNVDMLTFTGSVRVGKSIASRLGYRRLVLELGGNDVLIVLPDADLDRAAALAVRGAFQNSGQRCTAVKRILLHDAIGDAFLERLERLTRALRLGDPVNPEVDVGTVIDEAAARLVERRVRDALEAGARLCTPLVRERARIAPVVLDRVPADCELVLEETFGPVAPVLRFGSLDEAVALANGTAFGLSAGVCTDSLEHAMHFVHALDVGSVNLWEVPGYRSEASPFGGVKDSGLGVKEGVVESIRQFSRVKVMSLPWPRP